MPWQLQEAKQRLSEVVQKALDDGPQVVTRRGEEVVVVLSVAEYQRLTGRHADFKEFLRSAPELDGLDIRREKRPARRIEL